MKDERHETVEQPVANCNALNAAKMRDALSEISNLADALDIDNPNVVAILDQCRDALDAPPRNCDVGTPEEQLKRFRAFCLSRKCNECPFVSSTYGECGVRWAQMTYEEGGAE